MNEKIETNNLKLLRNLHILVVEDDIDLLVDGYELCKIIRLTNKNIPIAIMSNYNDNEKLLRIRT